MRISRSSSCISYYLLILAMLSSPLTAFAEELTVVTVAPRLQSMVDSLAGRLQLSVPVSVAIVPHDPLMVSVAPVSSEAGAGFRLVIDAAALELLTEPELEAAFAHELGHVWVYTHHPYLQTEQLANDIAMRVVDRSALESLYGKVWQRYGQRVTDARFAPPASASPASYDVTGR